MATVVAEKAVDYLDVPIVRVGACITPMPPASGCRWAIPSQEDIAAAVRGLLHAGAR